MQNNNNKSELHTHIENGIPTLEQELLPSSAKSQLQEQEEIIQIGLMGFFEAGAALARIKKGKLYDEGSYSTYSDYCQQRWGFSPSYANRLIRAATVVEKIRKVPIGTVLPQSESQARALLKSENPADDWIEAQMITEKEQPTANEIKAFIKEKTKEDIIDAEIDEEIAEETLDKTANKTPDETKQEHPIIKKWRTAPKAVVQFKNEKRMAIYRSAFDANRSTGIDRASIGKVCRHERIHAGGYSWKFAHEIFGNNNKLIINLEG